MTEVVLDASVVLKWFAPTDEAGEAEARVLREQYLAGQLEIIVPSLLYLELLNVTGRRWGWDERALLDLATNLEALGFEPVEPGIHRVAAWVARGLAAYDASYVAVAEERGVPLVSDNGAILELAGEVARPLVRR
ncbi:MAG TPA: type II toxin-antitoxin system VapC family toxin [Actinomycetota bacterium]|nr:type II toxin-antitoxin system VapC family toxin [Actinomycetota bacterium]